MILWLLYLGNNHKITLNWVFCRKPSRPSLSGRSLFLGENSLYLINPRVLIKPRVYLENLPFQLLKWLSQIKLDIIENLVFLDEMGFFHDKEECC